MFEGDQPDPHSLPTYKYFGNLLCSGMSRLNETFLKRDMDPTYRNFGTARKESRTATSNGRTVHFEPEEHLDFLLVPGRPRMRDLMNARGMTP